VQKDNCVIDDIFLNQDPRCVFDQFGSPDPVDASYLHGWKDKLGW